MYSAPNVPVDKGLGFDFSAIADFVGKAGTTALDIYKQQMQMKQMKALAQSNMPFVPQGAGAYVGLPMSQVYPQQQTLPSPVLVQSQMGGGVSTNTILMVGGLVVGGVLLFSMLGRRAATA